MQRLKCLPAMWETWVHSLGREDPLEKEMATHSSIIAWRIPWTEELGGLQSTGRKQSDTTEQLHFTHYSNFSINKKINWLKKKKTLLWGQTNYFYQPPSETTPKWERPFMDVWSKNPQISSSTDGKSRPHYISWWGSKPATLLPTPEGSLPFHSCLETLDHWTKPREWLSEKTLWPILRKSGTLMEAALSWMEEEELDMQ